MVKSVNQLVTRKCNSKCNMCNIWRSKPISELSLEEYDKLYSNSEFSEVEDICISGGEPTLRKDLPEIVNVITSRLPKLKMFFLSTNCYDPERVIKTLNQVGGIPEVYLVVSLEGTPETHKKIRGIDNYKTVLDTLDKAKEINYVKRLISTTLQKENCNNEDINYLENLAKETNCDFTFRLANKSNLFYKNLDKELNLNNSQKKIARKLIEERASSDPFMNQLNLFLSKKETIMGKANNLTCGAGSLTSFIDADGTIYPCIYNEQQIGDKKGFYKQKPNLKATLHCPCCTECQVYPKLNYGAKND